MENISSIELKIMEFIPREKYQHFRDRKRRYSTGRRDEMEEKAKKRSVSGKGAIYEEEIKAHVEEHLGKIRSGFQERWGDTSSPDILFVRATLERPYHIFVTSGVSDNPMNVPEGMAEYSRAELVIALPQSWPLGGTSIRNEESIWPVRWLKRVGRLPQDQKTWIGKGHTISNGDPWEPIADTDFTGVLVSPPFGLPPEFSHLQIRQGVSILFYLLIPLYKEEMDLKLRKGSQVLEELLQKHDIAFVLDLQRKNVAKKKGWFRS
ncbi:MAG: suppressor of fused domain protein [Deltaproteobacteria bacterium]|nr:suppressor of fused domain protein [Deltaproteobacteria bacterium]